jgi:hypothetical protein
LLRRQECPSIEIRPCCYGEKSARLSRYVHVATERRVPVHRVPTGLLTLQHRSSLATRSIRQGDRVTPPGRRILAPFACPQVLIADGLCPLSDARGRARAIYVPRSPFWPWMLPGCIRYSHEDHLRRYLNDLKSTERPRRTILGRGSRGISDRGERQRQVQTAGHLGGRLSPTIACPLFTVVPGRSRSRWPR